MCGLAGEFCFHGPASLATAQAMARTLQHRGPDETGAWLSPDRRCALAFQRLRVIDPAGSHQPMTSAENQLGLAFNGEIYNFQELRNSLPQKNYQTSGDTEVLLHALESSGPDALKKLVGMFALALYDSRSTTLTLARDRIGQKPLYYALLDDRIVFASEAKGLFQHGKIRNNTNYSSLASYLTEGYIKHPDSAWKDIHKLSPACCLVHTGRDPQIQRYWSPNIPEDSPADLPEDPVAHVRQTVREAVRLRMVADVPLGVLLSGGIDSAVVAALAAKETKESASETIKTFTAGFADPAYDERPDARAIADHLKTNHTELLIEPDPKTMLDFVVQQYDEPFADSSALPTSLICRETRRHVTVALTGDGGDEVFAGYDRYRAMLITQQMGPARYAFWRLLGRALAPLAPLDERSRLRRTVRFADALHLPPALQYLRYRQLFAPADLPRLLSDETLQQIDADEPLQDFCNLYAETNFESEVNNARLHDLNDYLPGDVLTKTDLASMAASLELRAPLLDHRVVNAGLGLPAHLLTSTTRGKLVLQKAFGDLLPPGVFKNRKRGFGVPLARWLREDLRKPMTDLLSDTETLRRAGLRKPAVQGLINDHLAGRADHHHRLWALMVLCEWTRRQTVPG